LRQQIITSVTTVKQAYYDLVADEMNVDVNIEAMRLAQQLLDNNKAQLQAGVMSPLDLKQAQSQLATSKANLLAAQAAELTQENVLKALLSDSFAAWANVIVHPSDHLLAVPIVPDLQESWRDGVAKRPDLLQVKVNLEKIGLQLKYDKNQLFPDLELTGGYSLNGYSSIPSGNGQFSEVFNNWGDGNHPSYNYGASISFPLSNTAARNTRKADKMTREQLLLTFKKTRDAALIAIQNDVRNIESNLEQVQATRDAEDYAQQALAAEQQKLAAGTSTIFNVIQLQSNLTTARFAAIQALDNYNKSVDQLSSDTGTSIEKNHITLEAR
jgi:outer membrane protein TolC